ncbi:MAG: hypothetical protein II993_10005 [Anaerotignum sp.]|nr:hypothetical protein [Anaerotignum sp.]MBQ3616311.1 hypothetical protein [Anaerotignum sp.]MBR2852581.1 hypothetical protein [Anaerotignum sp.]
MKLTLKNLSMVAALSFTLAFCTGMSATIMYQEHLALKPFMAAEMVADDLAAEADTANFDFS